MSSILNATTSSGLQIAPDNSGSLQLQTNNGTTALTIDTSQNVGIGTTSPTQKLDISGSGIQRLAIRDTGGTAIGYLKAYQADVYIDNGSATGSLIFQTAAGNNRMYIDSSGNVGIGTSSPSTKLDVNGTGKFGTQTTGAGLIQGSSDTFQVGLNINNSSTTNAQIWSEYTTGATTKTFAIRSRVANDTGTAQTPFFMDSSGYVTNAVNGLSAGRMLAWQYYRLNAGYAGSNATGAQSLFGVGVTLVGSTVYEFEAIVNLTKSAGTTSHTIALGFGGTATLNNIGFFADLTGGTTAATQSAAQNIIVGSSAASTVITGALANATYFFTIIIKGTVSVNAGGTFIPQYTLSAAPGGAYTTAIGSYIKIAPLGASGANTNIGSWA